MTPNGLNRKQSSEHSMAIAFKGYFQQGGITQMLVNIMGLAFTLIIQVTVAPVTSVC